LGRYFGAAELRQHAYFRDLDFNTLHDSEWRRS
jgi:hypothetical protein